MDTRPVTFDGLEAIALNEPVVDFVADGQVIDLHNGGEIVSIQIEMPADLVVHLKYVEPTRWTEDARPEREVELRFGGVSNLSVSQDADSPDEASSTFEHVLQWPAPTPRFELRTGNFELRFDAASVHLKHRPAA